MAVNDSVKNLGETIKILKNMGADWNPVHPKLLIPALETLHADAEAMTEAITAAVVFDNLKTKERLTAFASLNALVRRVYAASECCEMDKTTVEKVETYKDLIDGTNIAKATALRKKKTKKAMALLPEGETLPDAAKTRSIAQLKYEERLANFKTLIVLLETAGNYATNEADLSIAALKTMAASLALANQATDDAYNTLASKREERNQLFFGETDSIDFVMEKAKKQLFSKEGKAGANMKKMAAIASN